MFLFSFCLSILYLFFLSSLLKKIQLKISKNVVLIDLQSEEDDPGNKHKLVCFWIQLQCKKHFFTHLNLNMKIIKQVNLEK